MLNKTKTIILLSCLAAITPVAFGPLAPATFGPIAPAVFAGENLRLRDGVSFVKDLNQGFPILGDKLEDAVVSSERPTLLFFGASGDLNTNRQAKRIVDLYKKYRASDIKFIVVDVDHPANKQAKALIETHYQGYIPGEVLFNKTGKTLWSKTGEVELNAVSNQIDKALDAKSNSDAPVADAQIASPAPATEK